MARLQSAGVACLPGRRDDRGPAGPAGRAEAARLGARLIAEDLAELGITVDAAPVLDLPAPEADPVIGDRA